MDNPFLTQKAAAAMLGWSRERVCDLIAEGIFAHGTLFAGAIKYAKADVQAYIDTHGMCRSATELAEANEFERCRLANG